VPATGGGASGDVDETGAGYQPANQTLKADIAAGIIVASQEESNRYDACATIHVRCVTDCKHVWFLAPASSASPDAPSPVSVAPVVASPSGLTPDQTFFAFNTALTSDGQLLNVLILATVELRQFDLIPFARRSCEVVPDGKLILTQYTPLNTCQ
jgi:hypothetical protein